MWKVTLYNKHARCGYTATAKTRRAAFDKAFTKAGSAFRHEGLQRVYPSQAGADVMWLGLFLETVAYMRRGQYHDSLAWPNGMECEIRRHA